MAIVPMRQITVCGLKRERSRVLAFLQRFGAVQPVPIEADRSQPPDSRGRAFFEKSGKEAAAALEVLAAFGDKAPALSALSGRETLTDQQWNERLSRNASTVQAAKRILERSRILAEKQAELVRLNTQKEALGPWMGLAVPSNFTGTASTSALIGLMPAGTTPERLKAVFEEKLPGAPFAWEILFSAPDAVGVFLLFLKQDGEKAKEAARAAGFMQMANPSSQTPKEEAEQLSLRIQLNQEEIERHKQALSGEEQSFAGLLRFYQDFCAMRSEEYRVQEELWQSKHAFFLSGWVPEKDAALLEKELTSRFVAAVEIKEPAEDQNPPVALSNNPFTAPVESVVEAYSMPGKGEVDPSFILSLFYYLLFGLMLSDAGYGILMVAFCSIALWHFKRMEEPMRRTLQMFLLCGISTTIWGFLQGSFFGDIVGVVSSTFFDGSVTLPAIWFAPLDDPMRMLIFSLGLGVVHLFCGLGVNIAQHFRKKEYRQAFYDGIFWYLLVGGLILLLMTSSLFEDIARFRLALAPWGMTVLKGAIILGAAGIILTAGRDSKNWLVRILRGLYGLYNITGYLSDILSYSRLLALGLATGVIGTVINKMASMAAEPLGAFGPVVFVLIFLVGHAVNLGINLLGAYVHTNRLQFVEFFGKFYEGGGQKFEPFALHTKYYKLSKEDI